MESVEVKPQGDILIDDKEFPVEAKVPFEEEILNDDSQERSICLSALSNDLGLFFYAMGQRLVVLNNAGLMDQFKDAKDKQDIDDVERPSFEKLKGKRQATSIAFEKAFIKDEPITRIILEEETTKKAGKLAIGFKTKVIEIEAAAVLKGDIVETSSYSIPGGASLKAMLYIDQTLIVLDTSGKTQVASGTLQVSALDSMKILDGKLRSFSQL